MKPDIKAHDIESEPANTYSRRRFVGSMATGIIAASATPVLGQPRAARQEPGQTAKQSPAAQYAKPPFRRQQQEWPGLAGRMNPIPDHGEKSYKGSGRLAGRKALITGGDSGIGRAAAIAYAREGADVAISYLPAEEPDAVEVVQLIREAGSKAVALPGDIRDENFCKQLVSDAVRELGGLDILVNNAARQHSVDSILDLSTEQFDATFKTNLYAIFWITKAALPHFSAGASIINTSSVQAYDPSENLLDYAQTKAASVVHQISSQTTRRERHPCQRRRPRPRLDVTSSQRKPAAKCVGNFRGLYADGPPRPNSPPFM